MFQIVLIAVALAMDAFAVAICKGLAMKKPGVRNAAIVGLWFGGFQALMPTIGYFLGEAFDKYIVAFHHWVAFVLLALIGANMIKESLEKDGCGCGQDGACSIKDASVSAGNMFVMAVATSIDALAVGITFAIEDTPIAISAFLIGIITFALSALGVYIGSIFGTKYKSKAEFAGGVVLIAIGLKILLEGLGILA